MNKDYIGEKWKTVVFNIESTNETHLEISNLGRLRTFNKVSNGKILNGSQINGYRIIRLKFYTPRDSATKNKFNYLQKQVLTLTKNIKLMKQNKESEEAIKGAAEVLNSLKKSLTQKFSKDYKKRTIHYHSLVHRLVAEYFLKKPSDEHTIVAHLDHDKLNNIFSNLKWMTPAENYEHQKKSPRVIAEKIERQHRRKETSRATKLTVTKVMLLKKLLNEGKPLRTLVKHFKITDTQILRIKRGENWAEIEAAT